MAVLQRTTMCLIMMLITSRCCPMAVGGEVAVRLKDGNQLNGYLDDRTDDQQLWFRIRRGSTLVLRPIPWGQIAAARHENSPIPLDQLKSLEHRESTRQQTGPSRSTRAIRAIAEPSAQPSQSDQARRLLGLAPRTTSVTFDACLIDGEQRAERGTLLVKVLARGSEGELTPLFGVLEAELVVTRRETTTREPADPASRRLQHWTVELEWDESGAGAEPVELPLRVSRPVLELAPSLQVRLRLSAAGHGTFERAVRLEGR